MFPFPLNKLAGILIAVDKREAEITDMIIQLKNDQSKLRAEVKKSKTVYCLLLLTSCFKFGIILSPFVTLMLISFEG